MGAVLLEKMKFPSISIIIPNFNQGSYIEETILSIINQKYPKLELIIIDGGSTDNSIEVIRKFDEYITYWVSEPDRGQSHAINKGFQMATGDYIAWMNSDDCYLGDSFENIFKLVDEERNDFVYGPVKIGKSVNESIFVDSRKINKKSIYELVQFFYSVDYIIPSQSVFVKRDFLLKNNIGYLNESLCYCMDLDWYIRIFIKKPDIFKYSFAASFFRINQYTKTGSSWNKMQNEAVSVFCNYSKFLTIRNQKFLFNKLSYHKILNSIFFDNKPPSIKVLLKIIFLFPFCSLSDKRFMGLLKRAIF